MRHAFIATVASALASGLCDLPAAPALSGSKATGIFVLDNCDPDYRGKDSYADNISYIDGAGKVVFRVSGLNTCEMIGSNHQIAYDPDRKRVWVAECVGQKIRQFDLDGKEVLTIKDVKPGAIAVDPETGNLWARRSDGRGGGDTVIFDPKGKELRALEMSGFDVAYDPKGKAFWFAGKSLTKVSAAGKVLFTKDITAYSANSIAVHPDTGDAWVSVTWHPGAPGSRNQLLRFDRHGNAKDTIDLDGRACCHVTPDRKTGGVWVTLPILGVRRYSRTGVLERERVIDALAAHADAASGDLWVATKNEVIRMTPDGKITVRVKHAGPTTQAWVAGP